MIRKQINKNSSTILASRELRRSQTETEKIMWKYLRNRLFQGLKFRRQYPIGIYFADFYCPEKRLIIEIDEKVHKKKSKRYGIKIGKIS